jgi:Na+-transporting NADH:ubiquinone oxidoreductase subunit NqrC
MTDIHEKELADQIDREVESSDGLLLLVLCLTVTAGILVAGVSALLNGVLPASI